MYTIQYNAVEVEIKSSRGICVNNITSRGARQNIKALLIIILNLAPICFDLVSVNVGKCVIQIISPPPLSY